MSDQPDASQPHDVNADAVAQLQEALRHIDRSILLLQPLQPRFTQQYNRLREIRDQMEDAFTAQQTERLRAGQLNFEADVSKLRQVIDDLAAATERTARTQEIVGYVAMAIDIAAELAAKVIAFL